MTARVIRDTNFGISPGTLEEFKRIRNMPDNITRKELAKLIKRDHQIYEEEQEKQRIINANNANKNFSQTPSHLSRLVNSRLVNNIKHPISSRISRLLKYLRIPEKNLVVEGFSPPLSSSSPSSPSKGGYKKPNILKKQSKKPNILKKQPKKPNILKKQSKKPIKLKH